MSIANSFRVRYFLGEKIVGEITVQNWDEYSNALQVSNSVTIKGYEYEIKDINLFHDDTYTGFVTELYVEVEET
ncbi:hypothetical protein ACQ5SI_23840 [Peribacillus frigoritolerans]|uniref:hypothetical protein n=1 Tax=Peribacillus frigoritolerans TaxID=450367 RepID=UPI003D34DCD8